MNRTPLLTDEERAALPASTLTRKQMRRFTGRATVNGEDVEVIAEIRHDDRCGNGHNTFSITGDVYHAGKPKTDSNMIACGQVQDYIAEAIPELVPYFKWHLCSTDGPMHYLANALYHASNRDHNGHVAGEPSSYANAVKFGEFPIVFPIKRPFWKWLCKLDGNYDLEVIRIDHDNRDGYTFAPKYTFGGYGSRWHECPFNTETEALGFLEALQKWAPQFLKIPTAWSEGKQPDLEAARSAAIWPDAQLADFTREKLVARLPALMAEFKAAVESLGFTY